MTVRSNGIPQPVVRTTQAVIAVGSFTGAVVHPYFLAAALVPAASIVLFRWNPLAKPVMKLAGSSKSWPQEERGQMLFNQSIALTLLTISAGLFAAGQPVWGMISALMVTAASAAALCGYCIGCKIRFKWLMWRHRRKQPS
ncbi:DUF4395 family protein [Alkalicoccus luteus]|uniref:DUF4395 domain-containing protein n=1 Tax=Alkalicoccus luteus TaxID=1237094 RepID=A0A969PRV3_9BACI|nr:DUF4395 family protein [Alkalicoccus luteus]NJP37261.1 DUF4395 domain-containing protein [Alkalicoccus luteus]